MALPNKSKISLCMIVKNEEQFLRNCLSEAKLYCDELIVVDTGSTDRTAAIAEECGAQVFSFEWCHDFSAARNYSLQFATGDFILVLDADERLSPEGWETLVKTAQESSSDCFDLRQVNYTNELNIVGFEPNHLGYKDFSLFKGFRACWLARFFKNHQNYKFVGRVHEHLAKGEKIVDGIRLPVDLHHYGQVLDATAMAEKKKLYHFLGKEKVKDHPENAKAWHELGIASWEQGLLDEAANAFLKSTELQPSFEESWIGLGTVRQLQGQFSEAEICFKKVLDQNPNHNSAYLALGSLHYSQKKFDEAIACYQKQIILHPDIDTARFWLAACYEKKHQLELVAEPTFTVCYIVKNEEAVLEKSLKSVSWADEVIVYDTGSTDQTVQIAKAAGARVVLGFWDHDFSKARNRSLRHATQEWILVLDADELISEQDVLALKNLVRSPSALQMFYLIQTTYNDQSTILNWKPNDIDDPLAAGQSGYFESPLVRLFKNTPRIAFEGAVHEHAHYENKAVLPVMTAVRIHHFGKLRDPEKMAFKSDLYHAIGVKKINEMPHEPHAYYELAVQEWEMKRLENVEEYLKKALSLDPNHKDASLALACFYHETKRLADAIEQFAICLKLFPDNAEAHLFLASALIDLNKLDLAMSLLDRAEQLGFSNKVSLNMNRGVICLNQSRLDQAENYFLKAYEANPRFLPVMYNLAIVSLKSRKLDVANDWLMKAKSIDPNDGVTYKLLGEVLFNLGKRRDALDSLLKAESLGIKTVELMGMIIIAAYSLGQNDCAAEFENRLLKAQTLSGIPCDGIIGKILDLYRSKNDQNSLARLQQKLVQSGTEMTF